MQAYMIREIGAESEKAHIAAEILGDLPEWFGLPDSTAEYVDKSRKMPFWAAVNGDAAVGFIALKETSFCTAEIYVMGVRKDYHGTGIGKELYRTFLQYTRKQGYDFLQVKTVKEGCYREYDRTNAFYRHMGFVELECLPTLWDEWNPCQVYVQYIGKRGSAAKKTKKS